MTFILKLDLDMVKMYLPHQNKKVLQQDAYCPPQWPWECQGVLSKGVLSRGVCGVWEVWCPGGCGVKGDCVVREVVVSRGVCAPVHVGIHPREENDRRL